MRVVRDKPIVEVLMYVQEEGKDEKEREKRAGKWREVFVVRCGGPTTGDTEVVELYNPQRQTLDILYRAKNYLTYSIKAALYVYIRFVVVVSAHGLTTLAHSL